MNIKIKEIEATKEEITKYFHQHSYYDNSSKIILCYGEDGTLISKALISKPNKERLKKLLYEYGSSLREWSNEDNNSEYNDWLKEVLKLKDIIYLDYIESIVKNIGGATETYKYIIKKYKNIWLYSLIEVEEFWDDKMGLFDYGEHIFSNINIKS